LVDNDGIHYAQYASGTVQLQAGIYPISVAYFQTTSQLTMGLYWQCQELYGDTSLHEIDGQYFKYNYTPADTIPAIPSNAVAVAKSYKQIDLNWSNNSTNENGFEIYRSTKASSNYLIVGNTKADSTTFSDTTLFTKYTILVQNKSL